MMAATNQRYLAFALSAILPALTLPLEHVDNLILRGFTSSSRSTRIIAHKLRPLSASSAISSAHDIPFVLLVLSVGYSMNAVQLINLTKM
ncbi:hypothetical protein FRC03_004959 [Tulasnella sp. 419]|nr:hypothetical protein FRC03_004959 [Tulasnella sp. 419]